MKRDLIIQMRNEWRDNIWLILGLAVITAAVWTLTTEIYGSFKKEILPVGADIEDVYKLTIASQTPGSPDYIEMEGDPRESKGNDVKTLLETIRKSPYVEAAGISNFGLPYQMKQPERTLYYVNESGDTLTYVGLARYMTPDMISVLRIKSRTGKSEDELKSILENGELLVSNVYSDWLTEREREFIEPLVNAEEINGQKVILNDHQYRVGDMVENIRRTDYDVSGYLGTIIIPLLDSWTYFADEIAIRVKPESGEKFRREFESSPAMQRHGNTYLLKLQKMEDVADLIQEDENISIRTTLSLVIMLTAIVVLGIMGVFWFRIQQRISEIAIRKVCGANSMDIFRRVISEAMILLLIATMVAGAVCWPLMVEFLVNESKATTSDIFVTEIAVLVLLAVGIVLSLWLPARRAMRIEPAIAIKDE